MTATRSWKDVTPGVVAIALLFAAVVGILVFAQVGKVRGDTFRLFVRVDEGRGVMRGADVWLAGQVVGRVENVRLLPPERFPQARVLVELKLVERSRHAIRDDSDVAIGRGGQLVGNPGVAISIGSHGARVIEAGDTLVARDRPDLEAIAARAGSIGEELTPLMADVREISRRVRAGEGSAAILTRRSELLEPMGAGVASFRRRLETGRGPLAAAQRGEIQGRLGAVTAGIDSVRSLLASDAGSLGRLRRDTMLVANVEMMRAELDSIRALIDRSEGTAGRLVNDGALMAAVDSIRRQLDALITDAKARPLRYLSF